LLRTIRYPLEIPTVVTIVGTRYKMNVLRVRWESCEESASEPVKLASMLISYGQEARRLECMNRYVDPPQYPGPVVRSARFANALSSPEAVYSLRYVGYGIYHLAADVITIRSNISHDQKQIQK
jgi:hypothetical protein